MSSSVCTDEEGIDPYNGLWMPATQHMLFDKGFIAIDDNGDLLISKLIDSYIDYKIYIGDKVTLGEFCDEQKKYLKYHRDNIYQSCSYRLTFSESCDYVHGDFLRSSIFLITTLRSSMSLPSSFT